MIPGGLLLLALVMPQFALPVSERERERERLQCFYQPTSLIAFASEPGHIFRKSRQSRIKLKTCM